MKVSEASACLKGHADMIEHTGTGTESGKRFYMALILGADALNLQYQRLVVEKDETEDGIDWLCPNCGEYNETAGEVNNCCRCGQAVRW